MENTIRIHFTDAYGQGCIECNPTNYADFLDALRVDPTADDIWMETYDEDEGWQA